MLFKRRWDNPILTVVLLIALADAFGLIGLIIAPPVSVVCQILWSRLVSHRAVTGAAVQVSDLKERQAHLRDTIEALKEPPPPLVTSSMERLALLIEKAEPLLPASLPVDPSDPHHLSVAVIEEGESNLSQPTWKKQAMTAHRFAGRLEQLWKWVLRTAQRLNEWSHGWIGILVGAAREALKPDSVIKAAAIAYFSILSLFPLSLITISIASLFYGSSMDQQLILQQFEFIAPALGQLLGENIQEIFQARGPVTIVALLVLVWSASQIFFALTSTLNGIWNPQHKRPVWKRRGLAMGFVILFIGPLLFLVSFASSMIVSLQAWLPNQVFLVGGLLGFLMAVLLDIALFMIALPYAPPWRFNLA